MNDEDIRNLLKDVADEIRKEALLESKKITNALSLTLEISDVSKSIIATFTRMYEEGFVAGAEFGAVTYIRKVGKP